MTLALGPLGAGPSPEDPPPGDRPDRRALAEAQRQIDEALGRLKAAAAAGTKGEDGVAIREAEAALAGLRAGRSHIPTEVAPKRAQKAEQLRALATDAELSCLQFLALQHDSEGRYPPARDYTRQRLELATRLGRRTTRVQALAALGGSYPREPWVALTFLEQAKALLEPSDPPGLIQVVEGRLADVHSTLGQYRVALDHSVAQLEAARRGRGPLDEGVLADRHRRQSLMSEVMTLTRIGSLQTFYLGEPESGGRTLGQARELVAAYYPDKENPMPNIELAMAVSEALLGHPEEALRIGRRAEEGFEASTPLGATHLRRGVMIGLLSSLAELMVSVGRFEEAETYLKRVEAMAPQEFFSSRANIGHVRARAYLLQGRPAEAVAVLRRNLDWFDEARASLASRELAGVAYGDEFSPNHDLLVTALLEQGKTLDALVAVEARRGRLWRAHAGDGAASDPPTVEGMKALSAELDATLVVYAFVYRAEIPLAPSRIAGRQAGAEKALQTWVIAPTGTVRAHQLPLEEGARSWRASFHRADEALRGERGVRRARRPGKPDPSLGRLHELLIRPIEGWLPKDGGHVVFVPQGPLLHVPFAALTDGDGRPLVERYPTVTVPALGVLGLAHRRKSNRRVGPALVVGDPTITAELKHSYGLGPLPQSGQEARRVARLLGTRPLLGEQATREVVLGRMADAARLHFATHGLLVGRVADGPPGALVLASGQAETGLLGAQTIMELELKADLAVLSACSTGLGQLTGEGVVGLSYAFIRAGVPSVVVSLWPVPDASTAVLMTQFYRRLRGGKSLAQALRHAMLDTRAAGYADARQWAGFVLVGRW